MTVKDLERLYDYGYWANRKLFEVISSLTPEEFTQPFSGTHGSIRNTLVHILSAEWGWLGRCGGPERGDPLKPDNFPTLTSLLQTWNSVEAHVRTFLSRLTDADLARLVEFMTPQGEKRTMPLGELLHHGANHGVHHRGQLSLLLRMRGHSPENFDLLLYDAARRGVPIL